MTTSDWLMILAVLLAPVVAIQVSVYLAGRAQKRQQRLTIFRTLMTTRAARMAFDHVNALNMIDVEFAGNDKASKAVRAAWKAYLDHLNSGTEATEVWNARSEDLFVDLLHTMAVSLGYEFDKTHIRRNAYYPKGYGENEWDQLVIRRGIRELLEGKRVLPVWMPFPEEDEVPEQPAFPTPQELSQPHDDAPGEEPGEEKGG